MEVTMAETIVIQPVTRIEGHAKIQIFLDDTGNVSDTKVNIVELRGFEQFCIGRPVEELPRIVPRICGVCPWAHHLAAAKACDGVFGVDPPLAAKKLRELAYCFHMLHSHILHFFILAGADFVLGPDAPYDEECDWDRERRSRHRKGGREEQVARADGNAETRRQGYPS